MQLKKRNRKINMQEENGKKGICMILSLLLFSTHTVPQLNHFDSFIFFNLLDGEDKWRRLGRQLTAVMVSPAKRFFSAVRILPYACKRGLRGFRMVDDMTCYDFNFNVCVVCVFYLESSFYIYEISML